MVCAEGRTVSTNVDERQTAASDELPSGIQGRDAPRVVWLARIGVLFVLLQAYIYGRWIFSDQFTPAPTGSDPLSASQEFWIRCWDIVSIAACVGFLIWIVWKTVRDRAIPTLGIVTIAWMLTAWQDPGVNYIRPVFSYNDHFFNRGTWAQFIPGWVNHAGANPQPIFFWVATYSGLMVVGILGICQLLDRVRKAFPRINKAGLLALLFLFSVISDAVAESIWMHQGLWAYPRVNGTWSLFTGGITQLPLFEPLVFGGFVGTAATAIYYFRDSNGHMITDTGLRKLTIKRGRTPVRVLALCTVLNVLMLVFNMGWNMVNQHADTTPTHVPSYFSSELCGLGASSACPPPK